MDLPVVRYSTAKSYVQSIVMIDRSPDRNTLEGRFATVLPMSMLAGFALELYFKAWLLEVGRPPKEVKEYGHRLTDLYADVRKEGLPDIHLLDDLVSKLGGHEDYTFRYIEERSTVASIIWDAAIQVFIELDNVVDAKLSAGAARG